MLYINLGIYFRAFGSQTQPTEVDCHLFARLNEIAIDAMTVVKLLDFSNSFGEPMPLTTRHERLERVVTEEALPWLETCSTAEGAKAALTRTALRARWIVPRYRPQVMALLNV
jgi:hypothetical protein